MDVVNLNTQSFRTNLMTKRERCVIIETLTELKDVSINFLNLIELLFDQDVMNRQKYNMMMEMIGRNVEISSQQMWTLLIQHLDQLSFDNVVTSLHTVGCHLIAETLCDKKFGNCGRRINKHYVPKTKSTLSQHYRMKFCVDNNMFKNPVKLTVRTKFKKVKKDMKNLQIAMSKRESAADMVVLLTVLLLHQCKLYTERVSLLEKMKKTVTRCVDDKTTVDLVYHSKMAVTEARENNRAEALRHARIAETLLVDVQPCFASILAIHDHQYVYRQLYLASFSQDDLDNILQIGSRVMDQTADQPEDIQSQWNRTVLLYQAMSILKITSKFQIVDPPQPTTEQIQRVEGILVQVRKLLQDIEARREMIYSICMARLKELQADIKAAFTYQAQAVKLSNDGCFDEIERENIDNYFRYLKEKRQ